MQQIALALFLCYKAGDSGRVCLHRACLACQCDACVFQVHFYVGICLHSAAMRRLVLTPIFSHVIRSWQTFDEALEPLHHVANQSKQIECGLSMDMWSLLQRCQLRPSGAEARCLLCSTTISVYRPSRRTQLLHHPHGTAERIMLEIPSGNVL